MESCLYEGIVRHRRRAGVEHAFEFPLCMTYLDLEELDRVFAGRWLWSTRSPAVAWLRRSDYLGDPTVPLADEVRERVLERAGVRPSGPIRLLTNLRTWGYVQNPLSIYYCFGPDGRSLEHVLGDVTNTPWGERHQYVLSRSDGNDDTLRAATPKALHVSPFMGPDQLYRWRVARPGARLELGIESFEDGDAVFRAELRLERREISSASLARALLRYPAMTAQIAAGIYWQALRLRWKGARFHPNPRPVGGTPLEDCP